MRHKQSGQSGHAADLERIIQSGNANRAIANKLTMETAAGTYSQLVARYAIDQMDGAEETVHLDTETLRRLAQIAAKTAPYLPEAFGLVKVPQ